MIPRERAPLYSPRLLALAVELAGYPFDERAVATGMARSRTCGSIVHLSSANATRVESLGLRVTACAVGQAAAAIFADGARGTTGDDIAVAMDAIRRWLAGTGERPDWPRIESLEPALPHKGRHEAILLPWRAAMDALSKHPGHG